MQVHGKPCSLLATSAQVDLYKIKIHESALYVIVIYLAAPLEKIHCQRSGTAERDSTDWEESTLNELNELRALQSRKNKRRCHDIGPRNDDA